MVIMEGRQKPLLAPRKHLLIAQRRVGGGSRCCRLPCLCVHHSVPFRAPLVWSQSPEGGLQPGPRAAALASVLQVLRRLRLWARPWQQVVPLALPSQDPSACPTSIHECICGPSFDLAFSCLQGRTFPLQSMMRPPACPKLTLSPLNCRDHAPVRAAPSCLHLFEVPNVTLLLRFQ